jgi:phospho-N-acetylmuramoyl-pentapeptide-transferase
MYVLTKSVLALMIGFIVASVFGLFFVPFMKKKKLGQVTSKFVKQHKAKSGTPTLGGLIFIISTIITIAALVLTKKMALSTNLIIVLFVFFGYAVIGFVDDFMKLKFKSNEKGLTRLQKFVAQIVLAIIFFYLYIKDGSNPNIEITGLHINVNLGFMYGFFILFMLVGTSNAVNLTDGLDGLAAGLSVIAFGVYGMIAWSSSWLSGYDDIAIFCFILIGGLLGFLAFNSHPAKIFMGDTGSLALGGTLATIAILTRRELLLVIVGGVFVIETLSVILQIASIKLRGKRLIPMAPVHHSFEKMGWNEPDIVKLFYVVGFVLGTISIIYGVWI